MNQSITPHSDAAGECQCRQCLRDRKAEGPGGWPAELTRMIVCTTCGNKRCPHATDHRHACTGSNEPGQKGSAYQSTAHHPAPAELSAARRAADTNVEKNRELLLQRSLAGIAKYGTTTDANSLQLRDWLQHALEEALDMANYLQAAISRLDAGRL
jgi:hypothetical protein